MLDFNLFVGISAISSTGGSSRVFAARNGTKDAFLGSVQGMRGTTCTVRHVRYDMYSTTCAVHHAEHVGQGRQRIGACAAFWRGAQSMRALGSAQCGCGENHMFWDSADACMDSRVGAALALLEPCFFGSAWCSRKPFIRQYRMRSCLCLA